MISFLFPALAALASLTLAQQPVTLIATSLPTCAQTCPTLLQAQTACAPPPNGAAAVSDSNTYNSCFCNSAYLVNLKGQAAAAQQVCPPCPAGDTASLQSWFQGFCQNGGVVAAGANGQAPTSTTTTPPKTAAAPTSTGAKSNGGVTQDTDPAHENRSWASTHARWVVMIVVLFFGLLLFAFLLWFFHRRYLRKKELGDHSRAPGVQPDMNTWGPGQSVHDFHAPGEGAAVAAEEEKGKERATVVEQGTDSKRSSRRLKKPWV